MDAILKRLGAVFAFTLIATVAHGATFKTSNFIVTASSDEVARRVGKCAEYWREELAIYWLGKPIPNWYQPCPITVKVGQIGAGGQTTFTFENGEVYGWKMEVQGTIERVLDSVIPHEVNHTIFASHFRRPLPRWADEGAATLFEHESEQAIQTAQLRRVFHTTKRIPLRQLLTIREYPQDRQDVLTLYAEGYSLAGFLVGRKGDQGRFVYLQFLDDAHKMGWEKAFYRHYGYNDLTSLEQEWHQWVLAGSPRFAPQDEQLASTQEPPVQQALSTSSPSSNQQVALASVDPASNDVVIRSQSPTGIEPAVMENAATQQTPPALPAISRQLRVVRSEEFHQSENSSRNSGVKTASNQFDGLNAEEFRPRTLKNTAGANEAVRDRLSPTAEGIHANPRRENYAFPEARR